VLILGCTELPLVLRHCEAFDINGHQVALVDPTLILARKCIALAGQVEGSSTQWNRAPRISQRS
jgi:aspartate racemase